MGRGREPATRRVGGASAVGCVPLSCGCRFLNAHLNVINAARVNGGSPGYSIFLTAAGFATAPRTSHLAFSYSTMEYGVGLKHLLVVFGEISASTSRVPHRPTILTNHSIQNMTTKHQAYEESRALQEESKAGSTSTPTAENNEKNIPLLRE